MAILVILLLALLLRLYNLNQSLWLDEAINVVAARDFGFGKLITEYSLGDYHPPLFHPVLKIWISIFGDGEIAVRLPSVIFGVATVYVAYLLAKKLVNGNFGLLASLFLALAPYNIYFSQEARMYCLEGLLGVLAVYFFVNIIEKKRFWFWVGYTLSISLAIYVDYFGIFLPLVFFGYCLVAKRRELIGGLLISSFVSFILWLPWLGLFFKQFTNALLTAEKIPGWAKVVGSGSFKNLGLTFVKFSIGRIHFANKILYGLGVLPVLAFFGFLFWRSLRVFKKEQLRLLLLWIFVPVVVSFLISFALPIYQPFRLLYLLPVFYIFLAGGVFSFKGRLRVLTGGLVVLVSVVGLSFYYFNPRFYREDWRRAVAEVEKRAKKNDLAVFVSTAPMKPWVYYSSGKVDSVGVGKIDKLDKAERVFLFRYLWPVFDPADTVKRNIEEKFLLIEEKDFNGVHWQLYERAKGKE